MLNNLCYCQFPRECAQNASRHEETCCPVPPGKLYILTYLGASLDKVMFRSKVDAVNKLQQKGVSGNKVF